MNRKVILVIMPILLLGLFITVVFNRKEVTSKPDVVVKVPSVETTLSNDDVVGIWINHHDKKLHQKITFTANHRWQENQHGITNIYSGTWKRVGHNRISLAPYGEKIQLYGNELQMMKVLNYNHILDKESK
ncbi:hypothetical protein [Levilactobacillus enshiensis]|uniref:hypothetical protein n=1 Tax=Levilactobacillus enshiensis TaxID=2590213 RepID=UPI001CDB8993|nr:hypothetical protein [Levilactobacillus enshiensis]